MNSEKIENSLNLTLEEASDDNDSDESTSDEETWEVILKYIGEAPPSYVIPLLGGYGVARVNRTQLEELNTRQDVVYIERSKALVFATVLGKAASCINALTEEQAGSNSQPLSGIGTLAAFIDSGIDYSHPDFRYADGSSRIVYLWDQTQSEVLEGALGAKPGDYRIGVEYTRDEINEALMRTNKAEQLALVPQTDTSGHGTHVAGIAAGNAPIGVAPGCELIVVKLGNDTPRSFPRTAGLMMAVDYCLKKAVIENKPIAINLSFGNNYGSHSGNSLLETYLSDVSNYWKSVIVVGSGNEGAQAGHTGGILETETEIPFLITPYEQNLNLQLWKSFEDEFSIFLTDPVGRIVSVTNTPGQVQRLLFGSYIVYVAYGEPRPYSRYQEIYFDFSLDGAPIPAGLWKLTMQPIEIVDGRYDLWFPARDKDMEFGFLYPTPETTLTIPATADKVITVGAYDSFYNTYAPFSGRGYTRVLNQVKPDLVAPGVAIVSCAPGGGYTTASGTSMATPFVTGAALLMMEWGIGRGNDPYLYGEKIKAYLRKGAKPLPGYRIYPNNLIGYGALCLKSSLPI